MQYTINTSAGFFTIRGLKHREVKEIDFRSRVDHTGAESEKLQDDILLKIIGEDERLGELVEYERIMLFSKIIDLTFMTEDQRKNYNWQWASTLPETMTPAPTANSQDSNQPGDAQTSAEGQT